MTDPTKDTERLASLNEAVIEAARKFMRETVKNARGYFYEDLVELDDALTALAAAVRERPR